MRASNNPADTGMQWPGSADGEGTASPAHIVLRAARQRTSGRHPFWLDLRGDLSSDRSWFFRSGSIWS